MIGRSEATNSARNCEAIEHTLMMVVDGAATDLPAAAPALDRHAGGTRGSVDAGGIAARENRRDRSRDRGSLDGMADRNIEVDGDCRHAQDGTTRTISKIKMAVATINTATG